jgi:hypothetical protein
MLHFMAHCVASSSFRIADPNDDFQDAKLYKATAEPDIFTSKVLQQEDMSVIGEEGQLKTRDVSGSKEPEDTPCGMIQLNVPNPWPPNEIILDCTYVLLSTIHHGNYSTKIWSSALAWRDNFFEANKQWALNALLIERKNSFWERIGIAAFTQDAWKSANPQEQYIQLV